MGLKQKNGNELPVAEIKAKLLIIDKYAVTIKAYLLTLLGVFTMSP